MTGRLKAAGPLVLVLALAAGGCGVLENDSSGGVREVPSSSPAGSAGTPLDAALLAPADGSVNVPVDTLLRLRFSRLPADAVPALLVGPSGPVALTAVSDGGEEPTLAPDGPLAAGAAYTLAVPAGTAGRDGSALAASRVWHFTTAALPGQPVVLAAGPWGAPGDWAPVVRVDPVAGPAEVALSPEGGAPTDVWTVLRATTLFARQAGLAPHVLHRFRVTVSPLAGGPGADVALSLAPGWTDVTPAGLTAPLRDVAVLSRTRAYAAGDGGTLLRSDDGGRTWAPLDAGTGVDLNALAFVTPWDGFAAGRDGTLLHTGDGTSWTPLPRVTARTLHDVTVRADGLGLAVGDGGTVLRSADGGATWAPVPAPTTATLRRVDCAEAPVCRAVGDAGTILRSADGGLTWALQPTGTGADLLGYAARGGFRWAVGEGGIMLVGGGGSEDWTVRGATGQAWLGDILFTDDLHGWAVGTGDGVLATTDGGSVWGLQPLAAPARLAAVAAADAGRLLAVGTDESGAPRILVTDTGGVP